MRIGTPTLALMGLIAASALTLTAVRAKAQGCGGCAAAPADRAHSGHRHAAATPTNAAMEPIPSVLANYDRIQASLAGDSLQGVAEAAGAISRLAAGDSMKMLPAELGAQADALAKTAELAAARESFKQLSAALIGSLERQKVRTGHYLVYCEMAKAGWLQPDTAVRNPYFGASMSKCGEIKKAL